MTERRTEAWPKPPLAGTEAAAILGALERQRATLAWKCSGLDASGLRAILGTSTVTLGGLLKHLAHVEDSHFARLWLDSPAGAPGAASTGTAPPLGLPLRRRGHTRATARSLAGIRRRPRALVGKALNAGGLDRLGARPTRSGERPNLRRTLLDPLEEYARHAGHADLIRESVDGLTGEGPPR